MTRVRFVFLGTPELARVILRHLTKTPDWEVVLVVAQPDKPAGRGLVLEAPPVKQEALARGLPVLQPASARDPRFADALRSLAPDILVVAAYGQILPPDLLAIPRHGCLNVHTSLLPRWRGAAPIQWAILEGDRATGVTIMRMDAGLDTGDTIAAESIPIQDDDTSGTLHDRLAGLGADLLTRTLPAWLSGELRPVPQPTVGVTYARKLKKEDGRLDWHLPAVQLWRRVRAFNPWPGAFTTIKSAGGNTGFLKIWQAHVVAGDGPPGHVLRCEGDELIVATGEGALNLSSVQREGRRRISAREFLAADPLQTGAQLGV